MPQQPSDDSERQAAQIPQPRATEGWMKVDGRWRGYGARRDDMPLGGFATLVGLYSAGTGSFLAWAIKNDRLPNRFPAGDFALMAVGSHKLSRLIGKDFVTAPLRAFFTEYVGSASDGKAARGETLETGRGTGLRRAIGELLSCEVCLDPWTAAALFGTYTVDRKAGRFLGGLFAGVAAADFLQHAYDWWTSD